MKYYRTENRKLKVFFFYSIIIGLFFGPSAFCQIKVVTTTSDLSSIAKYIGGDYVKVYSFSTGSQNPLYIEPVPRFYWKLQSADLFITVGVDLEKNWLPKIINNTHKQKIQKGGIGYVDASFNVSLISFSSKVDSEKSDINSKANPYYWLDPENGKIIALNIYNGLVRVDPKNQKKYEANLNKFNEELEIKIKEWSTKTSSIINTKFIAQNNEWQYFAQRFNIKLLNGFGFESGFEPKQQIELLVQEMKTDSIQNVIQSSYNTSKSVLDLAQSVNGKIITLASSVWANKEVKTYFDLFDYNINQLVAALQNTNM